jgi:hypothetical protein
MDYPHKAGNDGVYICHPVPLVIQATRCASAARRWDLHVLNAKGRRAEGFFTVIARSVRRRNLAAELDRRASLRSLAMTGGLTANIYSLS